MEFEISNREKSRCKKNRIRNEKIWIPFRCVKGLSLIVFVVSFVYGAFVLTDENYDLFLIFGGVSSISIVVFVATFALISNFSSHWISSRLNEHMWIENGFLYHFVQTAFAAGLNYRSTDSSGYLFEIRIDSIRNARYDEKSRRIEFEADGQGYYYSDVDRQMVEKEWDLNGFNAVYYDYTKPSLYKVLKDYNVHFDSETLRFSLFDSRV